ncbi:unnamed protein product [Cochlearia groenlandica]
MTEWCFVNISLTALNLANLRSPSEPGRLDEVEARSAARRDVAHYLSCFTRPVVVAKNPCLHPGDVRVLQAFKVPYLSHMVVCVVLQHKGLRPHSNECSGSDLDGYIY